MSIKLASPNFPVFPEQKRGIMFMFDKESEKECLKVALPLVVKKIKQIDEIFVDPCKHYPNLNVNQLQDKLKLLSNQKKNLMFMQEKVGGELKILNNNDNKSIQELFVDGLGKFKGVNGYFYKLLEYYEEKSMCDEKCKQEIIKDLNLLISALINDCEIKNNQIIKDSFNLDILDDRVKKIIRDYFILFAYKILSNNQCDEWSNLIGEEYSIFLRKKVFGENFNLNEFYCNTFSETVKSLRTFLDNKKLQADLIDMKDFFFERVQNKAVGMMNSVIEKLDRNLLEQEKSWFCFSAFICAYKQETDELLLNIEFAKDLLPASSYSLLILINKMERAFLSVLYQGPFLDAPVQETNAPLN